MFAGARRLLDVNVKTGACAGAQLPLQRRGGVEESRAERAAAAAGRGKGTRASWDVMELDTETGGKASRGAIAGARPGAIPRVKGTRVVGGWGGKGKKLKGWEVAGGWESMLKSNLHTHTHTSLSDPLSFSRALSHRLLQIKKQASVCRGRTCTMREDVYCAAWPVAVASAQASDCQWICSLFFLCVCVLWCLFRPNVTGLEAEGQPQQRSGARRPRRANG